MSAAVSHPAEDRLPGPRCLSAALRDGLAEAGILLGLVMTFPLLAPGSFPTGTDVATVPNTAAIPAISGIGWSSRWRRRAAGGAAAS